MKFLAASFFFIAFVSLPNLTFGQFTSLGRTETIAETGQVSPDGNGSFLEFRSGPLLNDLSEIAFRSWLTDTNGGPNDDLGLFQWRSTGMTQIAREGQRLPIGSGSYQAFGGLSMNHSGEIAYNARLSGTDGGAADDTGVFVGSGGANLQIVREGQAAPDGNGQFGDLFAIGNPSINRIGDVTFLSPLTNTSGGTFDDLGLFRGSGGFLTTIVREGQKAPDGNGTFSDFTYPTINDSGRVAFKATLTGTSGGNNDDTGIFRGSGGPTTTLAREGDLVPDGNGRFNVFGSPKLNKSGAALFAATLRETSGGAIDDGGLFVGDGISTIQIAREGQTAPDADGIFSGFGVDKLTSFAFSDSGVAAFRASVASTSAQDYQGIFRGNGTTLVRIARQGQVVPDGNGKFSTFEAPALNESGVVAFESDLSNTLGGSIDNTGLYIGDGLDLIQVARKGASLDGSTITSIDFANGVIGGSDTSASQGLNQYGQVAYQVLLADGRENIRMFTPNIHWRETISGHWDNSNHWTLSLTPSHVHDVFIDPASDLMVQGPAAPVSVRTLHVGGGVAAAQLHLQETGPITVDTRTIIQQNGLLGGQGTIVGNLMSSGTISPGESTGSIFVDGNAFFTPSSHFMVELGGKNHFDRLDVSGSLTVNGDLSVQIVDGFRLTLNDEFVVADIATSLFGQFEGLNEGAIVGNYSGLDLFITYEGGSGNDIALFTAVPKPGLIGCSVPFLLWITTRRRKRRVRK